MEDLWIFGYGSILWKADFPHEEVRVAAIRGWQRRFWQGSTDHRGIPGQPGRVVTLTPGSECWGMAYRIHAEEIDVVLGHLDYRERGGYERLTIELHFEDSSTVGITYFANIDNPNYLGEAHPELIARQIVGATGPSGTNLEYLYLLEKSLAAMEREDQHVTRIATIARTLKTRKV